MSDTTFDPRDLKHHKNDLKDLKHSRNLAVSNFGKNIQDQVNNNLQTNKISEKLAVAKVTPTALEYKNTVKTNGLLNDFEVFANPFIESYYPILRSTTTDEFPGKNTTPKSENVENEKEKEKALKNFINSTAKKESELFHLHHHEHHHHYYINSEITDEISDNTSSGSSRNGDHRKEAPLKNTEKPGRDKNIQRRKTFEKTGSKNQKNTYIYEFTKRSSSCLPSVKNTPSSKRVSSGKKEELKKNSFKTENNSKPLPQNNPKNEFGFLFATLRKRSSSIDSLITNRRSNLIATHNYSDAELHKFDSDEININEFLTPQPFKTKINRVMEQSQKIISPKIPKPDTTKHLERIKNLNNYVTLNVLAEPKALPKMTNRRREIKSIERLPNGIIITKGKAKEKIEPSKPTGVRTKTLGPTPKKLH